jgi:hypothetical protein
VQLCVTIYYTELKGVKRSFTEKKKQNGCGSHIRNTSHFLCLERNLVGYRILDTGYWILDTG